jgi:hypothetical protein
MALVAVTVEKEAFSVHVGLESESHDGRGERWDR